MKEINIEKLLSMDIEPTTLKVYLFLVLKSEKGKWMGQNIYIGKGTNLTEATIAKCLKKLEENRLILRNKIPKVATEFTILPL